VEPPSQKGFATGRAAALNLPCRPTSFAPRHAAGGECLFSVPCLFFEAPPPTATAVARLRGCPAAGRSSTGKDGRAAPGVRFSQGPRPGARFLSRRRTAAPKDKGIMLQSQYSASAYAGVLEEPSGLPTALAGYGSCRIMGPIHPSENARMTFPEL